MSLRASLAAIAVLAACASAPEDPVPYAIVFKLDGYERHVAIDAAAYTELAAGTLPARFTVTMSERNSPGGPDAVFVREYRDGTWYSSSPSPGVIVDATPRVEPGCDRCHDDAAEELGMFTLHAAREAPRDGRRASIDCPAAGVTPCEPAVYRMLRY